MENSEENPKSQAMADHDRKGVRAVLDAPPEYVPASIIDEGSLASATIADPIRAAVRGLINNLANDIILPTVASPTRAELMVRLSKTWPEYVRTMTALHALLVTTPVGAALIAQAAGSDPGKAFQAAARKIAGDQAAEEVKFTEETYASALRIIVRFPVMPGARDLDSDRLAAKKFNDASVMHTLGLCMLATIGGGSPASPIGIEVAFEFLRAGAIDAYVAARTALALREPVEQVSDEPLPFDEEDVSLAYG